MLRGRCSCAISDRPTPSPALLSLPTSHPPARRSFSGGGPLATALVTPIIPVHPRNTPVSPIIPVHTQKQGGGGCLFQLSTGHPAKDAHPERPRRGGRAEGSLPSFSPNSFVFSCSKYYLLNSINSNNVGAPTFLILSTNRKSQKSPASEGGLL